MTLRPEWEGFNPKGSWTSEINVRDFIQANYTPYDGDESFLAGPTAATKKLFDELQKLQKEEHNKVSIGKDGKERTGVLDMDTDVVTSLTAHEAGYICPEGKDLEQVVGLQTDKPLKRAFMPYGGINMAVQS
ncbi:MAG: formate acetyltransferase, partial [Treponema sp.]|nr:formate acetyltransferase [Treponema sp.]